MHRRWFIARLAVLVVVLSLLWHQSPVRTEDGPSEVQSASQSDHANFRDENARWRSKPEPALPVAVASPVADETWTEKPTATAAIPSDQLQSAFALAAEEFGVPLSVLLSVSYNLSRWEHHSGESSTTGGYGLMHLPGAIAIKKADPNATPTPEPSPTAVPTPDTRPPQLPVLVFPDRPSLSAAAQLLGLDREVVQLDPYHNIRGGAALLAQYARDTTGEVPADPARWYGAVAKYSGSQEHNLALDFADVVFATINHGAARQTSEGQQVTLPASPVVPDTATAAGLGLVDTAIPGADCPEDLDCKFIPAGYHLNDPSDPLDYGNYDLANRDAGAMEIDYIVIHDAELPYHKMVTYFQQPWAYVSSHYAIRAIDGQVTQMVANKDIARTAGNWYINMHSINIEHEGYAVEGASWYSEPVYRASARLVRHLAERYNVPLDRAHIVGHDNLPGPSAHRHGKMHWDPGPFWDWNHYMELLGAPIVPHLGPNSDRIVTIKPRFAENRPGLSYCYLDGCRALPEQSASFVHVYSEPSFDAPLLDDPAIEGPGTTSTEDWGNRASAGQQFYRIERQGDWEAIYFGGQKGWFYSPQHHPNSVAGAGTLITPRSDLGEIPVYGRPGVALGSEGTHALQYSIPAGQLYVAADVVRGDDYSPSYGADPQSLAVIGGAEDYYLIFFNHRLAFVKVSDVEVIGAP